MRPPGRLLVLAATAALVVALAPTAWAVTPGPSYSWGWNDVGRLGTGSPLGVAVPTPTSIAAPGQFTQISAGRNHGCALGNDDSAYCWGYGNSGQLGNGTNNSSPTPVRVLGPASGFSATSAGNGTSCAIQEGTRAAHCWGEGSYGELGNGSTSNSNVPVTVSGGRTFTGIDVGGNSTCAVAVDDSAYCWGRNANGQLGNGTLANSSVPVRVSGSYRFAQVSVGYEFACGITSVSGDDTGPGVCWGQNRNGQLGGDDTVSQYASVPTPLAGSMVLRSISAGWDHACAVSTDDSVYCWGKNNRSEVGVNNGGADVRRPTRVPIPGDAPVRDVSAGSDSSCAITDDTTYCWGWTYYGQLGNNGANSPGVTTPVPQAVILTDIGEANSPAQVTSGEGYNAFIVKPRLLFPAGTVFPSAPVGQPTSTTVQVQNNRPGPMTITGSSVTGTGVSVTGGTCSGALNPGATCTVTLSWTSASVGALSGASLTINYVGNSSSTPLTGTATDPTPPPPPPTFPPGPPGDAAAIAGDASATVTWTAPTSPGSYPVTTYQVTSSPGGNTCLTSALTCTVTGLTNGTTYTFSVKALSGAGWGEASAPSHAVTPKAVPIPTITITGSRDGQRITVTGTAMHLDAETVRPWVRFPGEMTFSQGAALIPIGADGSFNWSRKSVKKTYVYIAHGTTRSNTVTIPAR